MNEEIKKAKECLDTIIQFDQYYLFQEHANTIETVLNQAEELQEFIRIVFNKNVFIWGMAYRKNEVKDYKPTYEYYKNHCGYFHSGYEWELMTEKEFDLVKKVVEKYGKKR